MDDTLDPGAPGTDAALREAVPDVHLLEGALRLQVIGGVLVPGGAAAAYVNRIDPDATDVPWFGQTALQMFF